MRVRLLFHTFRHVADRFNLQKLFLESLVRSKGFCLSALCFLVGLSHAFSADFAVTYTGLSAYAFNGAGSNPTLTLIRGQTYTFAVSTPTGPFGHPFRITNAPPGSTTGNN